MSTVDASASVAGRSGRHLTVVIAGLTLGGAAGSIVIGRYRRALAWFAVESAILVACGVAVGSLRPWPSLVAAFAVALAARGVALFDALRFTGDATPPRPRRLVGLVALLLIAQTITSTFVRQHLVESFKIPSASMVPTLEVGDFIFADKRPRTIRRGDVVIYTTPDRPDVRYIKRVVALGGDTIEARNGVLILNGAFVPTHRVPGECRYAELAGGSNAWTSRDCEAWEESLGDHSYRVLRDASMPELDRSFPPTTVPDGAVFLLGDNRDQSNDSRYVGAIPVSNISAHAVSCWFSRGPDGVRRERIDMMIR